ncbi:MAG: hypothetical protein ABJF04_04880 [Reichenbachiella sp.]|uniref:hypothetical protein n=2 Tax=Reichenbachiella sp. TaxID=2184521 RepID=UPI003263F201
MSPIFSQGFIESLDQNAIAFITGKPTKVIPASGEEFEGKLVAAGVINGYLNKITIKKEDGTKIKLEPENVKRLSVKISKLAKLSMMAESTQSIKTVANSNFSEIANREYIIFESGLRDKKKDKPRLMQLLNPGFDSKIKVFADPNAKETRGIGVAGVKLTGGVDKSYMFVVNGEKAVKVKKGNYKSNFDELYLGCPKMVETFSGEKTKWNDVAGHVFVYDQVCE